MAKSNIAEFTDHGARTIAGILASVDATIAELESNPVVSEYLGALQRQSTLRDSLKGATPAGSWRVGNYVVSESTVETIDRATMVADSTGADPTRKSIAAAALNLYGRSTTRRSVRRGAAR
jgi:hypothetical protein